MSNRSGIGVKGDMEKGADVKEATCVAHVRVATHHSEAETKSQLDRTKDTTARDMARDANLSFFGDNDGNARDVRRAVEVCREAARLGDVGAATNLGALLWVIGQGRSRMKTDAVHWLQQAATHGSPEALSLLGDAYWEGGGGLAQDDARAIDCWKRSVCETPLHHSVGTPGSAGGGVEGAKGDASTCLSACCKYRRGAGAGGGGGEGGHKVAHENEGGVPPQQQQQRPRRVAIIGAGPSGLAVLKECIEQGMDAMAFEQQPSIGGAFASAYEGAMLTSSSVLTAFGSYSDGRESNPVMWSATQYVDYLEGFAEQFDLNPHITLGARVAEVKRDDVGGVGSSNKLAWHVRVVERGSSSRWHTFDALAVCAGLHQTPAIPTWAAMVSAKATRVIHSSEFERASDFEGQRVLVVGLGESGSDISLLLARHGAQVAISTRRGPGAVVPRFADPITELEPADLATNRRSPQHAWGPSNFSWLTKALRECTPGGSVEAELARCFLGGGRKRFTPLERDAFNVSFERFGNLPYNRFGTKNLSFLKAIRRFGASLHTDVREVLPDGTVVFDDGSTFENCTTIVLCTGYSTRFPFFEDHLPELAERAVDARSRFKHMICAEMGPSLAFIGYARPAFGAVPPMSELAARYWTQLLTGERVLPDRGALEDAIGRDRDAELRLFSRDRRLSSLTQYQTYMNSLAGLIGCRPNLALLRTHHVQLWQRAVNSSFCGAQFRLHGVGAMEHAWSTLARMPLPRHRRQPCCAADAKARSMIAFCEMKNTADPASRSWLWADIDIAAVRRELGGLMEGGGGEGGGGGGGIYTRDSTSVTMASSLVEHHDVKRAAPSHFAPVTVSADASVEDLAEAFERAREDGVVRLLGAGVAAPLGAAEVLFDALLGSPATVAEAGGRAYNGGLSFKGCWGDTATSIARQKIVDQKRVLDLTFRRTALGVRDPTVDPVLAKLLEPMLDFLDGRAQCVLPRVHEALSRVTGCPAFGGENWSMKYRLSEYFERQVNIAAPPLTRCTEHRDYGTVALIFDGGVEGLEVLLHGAWRPIMASADDALLMIGWATHIRSNGRVAAPTHRVLDPPNAASSEMATAIQTGASRMDGGSEWNGAGGNDDGMATKTMGRVARRISFVAFSAPPPDARLGPVLIGEDDTAHFRTSVAGTAYAQSLRAHHMI